MHKKNHRSLKTVAEVSTRKERESAMDLAEVYQQLNRQLEQLEQLHGFRGDYASQAHRRGMDGAKAREWGLYGDFLEGIDKAIASQERDLENTHTLITSRQRSWRRANRRSRAINDVVDRAARYLARRDERRQQAEVEDQAWRSRRHR